MLAHFYAFFKTGISLFVIKRNKNTLFNRYLHSKALHKCYVLFIIVLYPLGMAHAEKNMHHDITAEVTPSKHYIKVKDTVTVSPLTFPDEVSFYLHGGMKIGKFKKSPLYRVVTKRVAREEEVDSKTGEGENSFLTRVIIKPVKDINEPVVRIPFEYEGTLFHPLTKIKENYSRAFEDSRGIISKEGVVLGSSSYWYPISPDADSLSFRLQVSLPGNYRSVSQGEKISGKIKANRRLEVWRAPKPTDTIYLIAGPYTEYKRVHKERTDYVFLRDADKSLANTYLDATSKYIDFYQNLIGTYPYKKFAMVENFWETGFGMPSFTLLGSTVLRLPFIPYTSYPHEILHNWWGNSVFVDYKNGNWCEGLTNYLADHLLKEQRNKGVEFRRNTLQKYLNYVKEEKDFPLSEFQARQSSASQAIGYGKASMFFHMLKQMLGRKTFIDGIRLFYKENKFKTAGYDEIRKAFESVSKKDLRYFFDQWVKRTGAPELMISGVSSVKDKTGYTLRVKVKQIQKGKSFRLSLPFYIASRNGEKLTHYDMRTKEEVFSIRSKEKPSMLIVDPQFDIFRKLRREEIPPSISQALGADKVAFILPKTDCKLYSSYLKLAKSWTENSNGMVFSEERVSKSELENYSVWVLGKENRFKSLILDNIKAYGCNVGEKFIEFPKRKLEINKHSFTITANKRSSNGLCYAWLCFSGEEASKIVIRKIPHYGKYSYLAFYGNEGRNVLKGVWPVVSSPMRYKLDGANQREK